MKHEDPTELIEKFIEEDQLTEAELKKLEISSLNTEYLWLQPGYEILTHMKSLISNLAEHLEDHLTFRNLQLAMLGNINYLFTAKLVDWKQKRFTIFDVIEISERSKNFTIKARNCFETFSNCIINSCRRRTEIKGDCVLRV